MPSLPIAMMEPAAARSEARLAGGSVVASSSARPPSSRTKVTSEVVRRCRSFAALSSITNDIDTHAIGSGASTGTTTTWNGLPSMTRMPEVRPSTRARSTRSG